MSMDKNFDATEAEARIYAMWEAANAFEAGKNAKPGTGQYSVMIPPPNVTGSLHMGHAFNNTLQDILVRWHRMRGFDTLWQPGTDHAGIATQMVTERDMAANGEPTRRDMGREAFLERVWQQKIKSRGTIIGQLKRLGASCDWSREAFTMSGAPNCPAGEEGNFHDAVIKVFVEMYNKGLIYRGKRLVNWDPHFETAISDLEVENIEVDGHMWHFKYPLAGGETYTYVEKDEDGTITLSEERNYISIATTRPETMLGDGAVAVHPSDERYAPIVGKLCEIPVGPKEHRRLIPIITDDYPDKNFGSGAVKITGAHDFNDYAVAKRGNIPCYRLMDTRGALRADGAPYAKEAAKAQAFATGTPFTEAEIDAINLVPEAYRGMDRFEARKAVVADITAEGLAVTHLVPGDEEAGTASEERPFVENKKIMQPFGDRSKVVIEPMLTDQWFVDTAQIVEPALEAVRNGTVRILPEQDKKVYFHWLENIEPWCISRQLWWGHQIPVWYGPHPDDLEIRAKGSSGMKAAFQEFSKTKFQQEQAGNDTSSLKPELPDGHWEAVAISARNRQIAICAATESEALEKATKIYGNDVNISVHTPTLKQGSKHRGEFVTQANWVSVLNDGSDTIAVQIERDPDVLDTWFSSGLWPIGTLGWPEETDELAKYFPTSDLITGQDILFFWVARMMMMQLAVVGQVPFNTIYLHGLVRDAKGKKMSKSLGNVVDPLDIIDEYGADALRFTNAAMASLGGALKLDTQRIAGYRNFGTKLWNAAKFADMYGAFDATADISNPRQTLNRWIIGEVARTREAVDEALTGYRFNDAANALYTFVWGKVCDWYVEFSKPILQGEDGPEKLETQATLKWVLEQCMILLHPIMPFITEELWGELVKDGLLIHRDWPTYGTDTLLDAGADTEMNWVITLIESIRSTRQQMHVPAGAKIPLVATQMNEAAQTAWDNNSAMILRLARIDSLDMVSDMPKGCATVPAVGATFGLPLAGIIDVAEEKARLEKTLAKLDKEMGGLKGRLNNPNFIASAPEDVVDENRARLIEGTDEADKLREAIARLAELA